MTCSSFRLDGILQFELHLSGLDTGEVSVPRHINELLTAGLVYMNNSSGYASPPRIVPKTLPGDYRMTVDTMSVNAITDPYILPMPHLEVTLGLLDVSKVYFKLDWFRGYWQLPLHVDSRELFTIMTHRGMVMPTRVLVGGTDSVGYCQNVVEEIFQPLLYHGLLTWLDNIVGYATTIDELLDTLEKILAACAEYGLKLHPDKCRFFLTSAKWCGKVVGAAGLSH
ncbi:hypothetical protein PHMEG_00013656 [Phytophthora megakarya]|uniref:Reverse transcriptase domain-containing protein n=1 Tax=Phytophthora megakarya TaxID=4795 RepID=A0A225W5U0_9STRA|nr:hypothetical protein PHMEG_00013656 [Phytophthora megakarya]